MPLAVNDMAVDSRTSRVTAAAYRDAVIGDLARAGKRESIFRDLIGAIIHLGGEGIDWQGLSKRVSTGLKNTVASYLDVMERCFLLAILHQPKTLGSCLVAPRKARKLHFRDPFMLHVFDAWASGAPDHWISTQQRLDSPDMMGRLVESTVAGHLLPRVRRLMHWRGSGEIDLLGRTWQNHQLRIEVKYQEQIVSQDKRASNEPAAGSSCPNPPSHSTIQRESPLYRLPCSCSPFPTGEDDQPVRRSTWIAIFLTKAARGRRKSIPGY